jgi:hypothetical protein
MYSIAFRNNVCVGVLTVCVFRQLCVLVICVLVFTVFLYCFFYVYSFLFVSSLRTTTTE